MRTILEIINTIITTGVILQKVSAYFSSLDFVQCATRRVLRL